MPLYNDYVIFFLIIQHCGKRFGRQNHLKRHVAGVHRSITLTSMELNPAGEFFDERNEEITPHQSSTHHIIKSKSKRKSSRCITSITTITSITSLDNSTASHQVEQYNNDGICEEVPLDQNIFQEHLMAQDTDIQLTHEQIDLFNPFQESESAFREVPPVIEMLSTPPMRIEEDMNS